MPQALRTIEPRKRGDAVRQVVGAANPMPMLRALRCGCNFGPAPGFSEARPLRDSGELGSLGRTAARARRGAHRHVKARRRNGRDQTGEQVVRLAQAGPVLRDKLIEHRLLGPTARVAVGRAYRGRRGGGTGVLRATKSRLCWARFGRHRPRISPYAWRMSSAPTLHRENVLDILRANASDLGRFNVRSLALFGSVARDDATASSDVDVLVDFEGSATFDRYMGLKFYIEDLLGCRVDLVTRQALRDELRSAVEAEAIRVA